MQKKVYHITEPEKPEGMELSCIGSEDGGIVYLRIHMESGEERSFPPLVYTVAVPSCGVYDLWTPKLHLIKALNLDWYQYLKKTNGFTGAPVQCLISAAGQNCAALGLSDTLNPVRFETVPVEETGEYAFTIEFFVEDQGPRSVYDVTLRLDLRELPYYQVLKEMSAWWEEDEKNRPAAVPADAREPMYSTWYSFHQMLEEEALLAQCRLARELGCKSILIDDGWQTGDQNRGYAYCGDWKPAPSKIPDMASFVRKAHELGMKVIPWYSLPFIGERSDNFRRFRDMLVDPETSREWHVLDPRYPQVREFIISLFEEAVSDWDVDGFKMDFIDEFVVTPFSGKQTDERRDFLSFHEAAYELMKECAARLRRKKPEILLEFRQTYNGPLMRSCGNIFRAVDCPFDAVENRVRVTDVRLLCGDSAVHSDMLMWHVEDTAENAALQIINVLFSVPQISMRLDELPEDHRRMLGFYCSLWKQYQDAFINGAFEPLHPAARYDVIRGNDGIRFVCAVHGREVVAMERLYEDMLWVNGSAAGAVYLENESGPEQYRAMVYDCRGDVVWEDLVTVENGLNRYPVPTGGAAQFQKQRAGGPQG